MNGPAYITYFDQRYLARAIVMLRSLRRHDPETVILPLCLDALTFEVISGLGDPMIRPIPHEAVLAFEPRLRACADRPRQAYYATHKPALPLYVLDRWPELTRVTHIDADTRFHASPAPMFAEAPDASILVSPHRYPPGRDWSASFGRFNAGLISWRNDETAKACLAEYLEQCIARVERSTQDGEFMNQGYLTPWPERYAGVHVIAHPGSNLAPWNVLNHTLTNRRVDGEDRVSVDGQPLIFFHVSGVIRDADGCWRTSFLAYGEANVAVAVLKIYQPYFREVEAEMARLGVTTLTVELPDDIDDWHYLT
jgi:hypothetical protein